jgi:hypothetical protein
MEAKLNISLDKNRYYYVFVTIITSSILDYEVIYEKSNERE